MCLLPEQIQAIKDHADEEYDRGQDDGYRGGFADGLQDGVAEGRTEGFEDGYDAGFEDGKYSEELVNRKQSVIYKTAYERGFKAGRQEHLDRDTLRPEILLQYADIAKAIANRKEYSCVPYVDLGPDDSRMLYRMKHCGGESL